MQTLLVVGLLLALGAEIALVIYLVRRHGARAAQARLDRERAAMIDAPRSWSDPPTEWEAADVALESDGLEHDEPKTLEPAAGTAPDDGLLGKAVVEGPRRRRRR